MPDPVANHGVISAMCGITILTVEVVMFNWDFGLIFGAIFKLRKNYI